MAAANKPSSSSPIASARPNPSARNSETKDLMRRSFTGNPFNKPSSIVANSRGGFSPNTPANSPSDFTRRNSIGRESFGSLRDFEDKENGKETNLKTAKVRSPASGSKGSKNFMSPTISAASKFTASPRKKILVERNDSVRSSVSFSDVKSQVVEENGPKPDISLNKKKKTVSFSDVKSLMMEDNDFSGLEMGLNQSKIEASHDSKITDLDEEALKSDSVSYYEELLDSKKNDGSSLSEIASEEKDCVNLDPTFKISPKTSCSTSSSMLAPLDADPLMPPYDPKTNYLSPRPQFLRYRPNPRIERILNKDKDGNWLEESFVSENLSDSEVSGTISDDSQEKPEDVSSSETVIEGEEEAVEEEEEHNVSEPKPFNTPKPKEESVQPKGVSKSKFFTRSKFISFLLVLVFACLSISVIDYPGTDLSMLKDLDLSNLYVPPEISEFAKVNIEGLAQRSKLWASNSLSYICDIISNLREVPKLGSLQFTNLTDLFEEDRLVDGHLKLGHRDGGGEFKHEDNMLAPIWGSEIQIEALEEDDPDIVTDENIEEVLEQNNSARFDEQLHQEIDEVLEHQTDPEVEEVCLTPPAAVVKPSEAEKTQESGQSDNHNDIKAEDLIDQPAVISEATQIQPQAKAIEPQVESNMNSYAKTESTKAEAKEPQVESEMKFYSKLESTRAEEIPKSSELGALMDHQESSDMADTTQSSGSEDKFLTTDVVGISFLALLSLLAAISFFYYANKGKLSTPNATIPMDQPAMTKKLDYIPISVISEHAFRERLSSRNWQTEVDMVGESCPSEMSSFKSSSYTKKELRELSEAQSQERKPRKNYRRESLASSEFSMGSPSYGSFTTYEKIPSKHGHVDEEVVTPVRRSSRLRSQVTSP